ncbi:MAG: teichoic acid D-Ala incorporation-associated protein DltX [Clostridiales Family XIII bacterium]|nr:teichoic acid D-Ala incorporation-associated protein DltX [Clostridiales Family XIII bacterium]
MGGILVKSAFYCIILLILVYMYHYSHTGDATFIYNEF